MQKPNVARSAYRIRARKHVVAGMLSVLAIVMASVVSGCMSYTTGSSTLSQDKVDQIKKEATTSQEIQAMFGPPGNVSIAPGGKRIMNYFWSETNSHASGQSFIPIYGAFNSKSEGQTHTKTLQIDLDARGIVEDFQYNDSESNIEASGGMFGTRVRSTPTTSPSP